MWCSLAKVVRSRPWKMVLVLVLLVLVGTGAGLYGYALRQWHAAQAAVKAGRPAEAQSSLKLCLLLWPRSVPVHLLAARAARLLGNFPEAEAHLNQCLKLRKDDTDDAQLEFRLMRVQWGQVDEDDVGPVLLACVANHHPETSLILETLAQAYMHDLRYGPALGCLNRWLEPAEARGLLENALAKLPNDKAEVRRLLEDALAKLPNDDTETRHLLETARAKLPSDEAETRRLLEAAAANLPRDDAHKMAQAYYWRGWVRERLNHSSGAFQDYQRALELDPDLFPARLRVAEIFLERSNPPEALPHLERLLKQYPDRPEVLARLGQCRFLQGQPEEARRLLEAAVVQLPNDSVLLLYLAKLDLQEGRPAKAEEWVRRVLRSDPTDTEAQYTLVASLRRQGRHKEAEAALAQYQKDTVQLKRANKLLQEEAENPTSDPAPLVEIGSVFIRAGQGRVGEYWLRQALQRDPEYQPAHKALAEYYEARGQREKAAEHRRHLGQRERKPGVS